MKKAIRSTCSASFWSKLKAIPYAYGSFALLLLASGCKEKLTSAVSSNALLVSSDPPTLSIANLAPVFSEADGTVSAVTIAMDHRYTGTITIPYEVLQTTTTYTDQSLPSSGTITISPSAASGNLTMTIFQDVSFEPDETIEIRLGTPSVGNWQGDNTLIITIHDDDAKPSVRFASSTMSVDEALNTTTYPVVVELTGRAQEDVTVAVRVLPCLPAGSCSQAIYGNTPTGSPPSDFYIPGNSTGIVSLTIPAGTLAAQFNFQVFYNPVIEPTDRFRFHLESPSANAQLNPVASENDQTVSINDNQNRIQVAFASSTTQETEGWNHPANNRDPSLDRKIYVNLSRAPTTQEGPVSVNLTLLVAPGFPQTATSNSDFILSPANLIVTIAAGQTSGYASVELPDDHIYERASGSNLEQFNLGINSVSNNAVLVNGGIHIHRFFIVDNDPYPVLKIENRYADQSEGNGGGSTPFVFTVRMTDSTNGQPMTADQPYYYNFSRISNLPVPANYTGNAPARRLDNSDYSTTVLFQPSIAVGTTFTNQTVNIRADSCYDGGDEFTVVSISPPDPSLRSPSFDSERNESMLIVREDDPAWAATCP